MTDDLSRRSSQRFLGFERLAFIDGIGALTAPIVCHGTRRDRWFPKVAQTGSIGRVLRVGELTLMQVA